MHGSEVGPSSGIVSADLIGPPWPLEYQDGSAVAGYRPKTKPVHMNAGGEIAGTEYWPWPLADEWPVDPEFRSRSAWRELFLRTPDEFKIPDLGPRGSYVSAVGLSDAGDVLAFSFELGEEQSPGVGIWNSEGFERLGWANPPQLGVSLLGPSGTLVGRERYDVDSISWKATRVYIATEEGPTTWLVPQLPAVSMRPVDINASDLLVGTLTPLEGPSTGLEQVFSWENGVLTKYPEYEGVIAVSNSGYFLVQEGRPSFDDDKWGLRKGDEYLPLPWLGGKRIYPQDVNSLGIVVGYRRIESTTAPSHLEAVSAWSGVVTSLNKLIDPDSGWYLISADAINDAGQIMGRGIYNGYIQGYRLDPTD